MSDLIEKALQTSTDTKAVLAGEQAIFGDVHRSPPMARGRSRDQGIVISNTIPPARDPNDPP